MLWHGKFFPIQHVSFVRLLSKDYAPLASVEIILKGSESIWWIVLLVCFLELCGSRNTINPGSYPPQTIRRPISWFELAVSCKPSAANVFVLDALIVNEMLTTHPAQLPRKRR